MGVKKWLRKIRNSVKRRGASSLYLNITTAYTKLNKKTCILEYPIYRRSYERILSCGLGYFDTFFGVVLGENFVNFVACPPPFLFNGYYNKKVGLVWKRIISLPLFWLSFRCWFAFWSRGVCEQLYKNTFGGLMGRLLFSCRGNFEKNWSEKIKICGQNSILWAKFYIFASSPSPVLC